jgi:hypothetical protein
MSESLEYYLSQTTDQNSIEDSKIIDKVLEFFFNFSDVECIETGTSYGGDDKNFGLYLAHYVSEYGGRMSSVDIDWERCEKSQKFIESLFPNVQYKTYTSDSVEFLKNYQGSPNLVLLDSYDLDITNPLPSMLHHWLEFVEIKDKMRRGSILIIDDNFFRGTTVYWNVLDHDGNLIETIPTDIKHEITGKGALIYHAVKEKRVTDWELIGDHYKVGPNQKLIFRKL